MNLHTDRDAFSVLIANVNQRTGIRSDIIEKDYYVCLLLFELAQKQGELPAYFKGGTALYKAMKTLNRFSEDIDLTVEINDCSKNQGKLRLERATNKYVELPRTANKESEHNSRGSITAIYDYVPVTDIDPEDVLQRFGHVKVESTSFTVSEPFEVSEIEPLLYTKATDEERHILQESFQVAPFSIKSIKQERIFADKILAAEFYYVRNELFDVSKHLYDLAVMMKLPRIQILLNDDAQLAKMLGYKRLEETFRIGSDLSTLPLNQFKLFSELKDNRSLKNDFRRMQEIYVFNADDTFSYDEMVQSMEQLYSRLLALDEGL
ncbi:nucleotidyl transferase AbiEii/AbiGii toxin family protein [Bengtsoniella intestinalis]|uniref:nucleotidyl transferase AbiEii/AbiGii toxin family protein n=1 Tax=Bengtsoniella intestinalis TaxID=3073143 RepID=UPI00391F0A75